MSDEEYRQEGINMQLKPIKDRLDSLEKKFEAHLEDDSEEIRNELARQVDLIGENIEQIAKLQENQKNGAKQHLEFIKSINELKSDIGNVNKILEVITEGRVLELEAFNNLEDLLRDYFKYRKDWSELIMKKSPFRSPLDTWMMISLHKFMKDALKKLDFDPVQNRIDRLDAGFKILKKHEEGLKDVIPKQAEKGEIDYGEWAKEMEKKYDELIEGFKDKLEFLRDKVLEAPILSGSVQDLRDHIHDLKDLVVKNINEYEGMLNK